MASSDSILLVRVQTTASAEPCLLLYSLTQECPDVVRLLAAHVNSAFEGAPFLAIRVQTTGSEGPHKDGQNSHLPPLVCNLSPGAPGGTWTEDPSGKLFHEMPRWGDATGTIADGVSLSLECEDPVACGHSW